MKISAIRAPRAIDGQWVALPGYSGARVCIRPTDDVEYRREIQNEMQPHSRIVRAGRMLDPTVQDKMTARAVARVLLRDWSGFEDEDADGKSVPLPFSRELVLEWAEDPEYAKFFRAIEREGDILAQLSAEEIANLGKS